MKKAWLTGPVLFVLLLAALMVVWAVMEPTRLIACFDNDGYSPFELATIPFFLAIVPFVWWKCPFDGSRRRQLVLCSMVTVVVLMAVVKELDLHVRLLHLLYPDIVGETGTIAPGRFFKPNGDPLKGTPFKMRVLTNGAIPFGLKAFVIGYFTLFFGVFAAGFLYLLPTWIKGVFKLDPSAWSIGCFGASGALVQVSDRLPSWLDNAGGLGRSAADGTESAASSLCIAIEEGGEMMIAIFALLAIYQAHLSLVNKQR